MSIDPVTFVAQLVNLGILIFLLQKLLYKPLLNAVDSREAKISQQMKSAREAQEKAEQRLALIAKQEQEMQAQRSVFLNEARAEADKLRERLENQVREETAAKRASWADALEAERKGIERDLRTMLVGNFAAFSKKALSDLADADLESRFVFVLQDKFDSLPKEDKNKMKGAQNVEISTAKPLEEKTRQALVRFVCDKLDAASETVSFIQKESLSCGVEIVANGNVLSWNLETYLADFTKQMNDSLAALSERVKNKED